MKFAFAVVSVSAAILSATAQTPPPEYAFLVERVTFDNKDGIVGLPPGTRVEIIAHGNDKITVRAEGKLFNVPANQITTDPIAGKALRQQDVTQQAAVQQQIAANSSQVVDPKQDLQPTGDQNKAIWKRVDEINAEIHRLEQERDELPYGVANKVTYTKHHTAWGHIKKIETSPNAYAWDQQRKAIDEKIAALEDERAKIKGRLK
jgi:hypothetical protein